MNTIDKLKGIQDFLNQKYYEMEDYIECILLSFISRTNMIALGPPGIAKSAILRELVACIDFEGVPGTPYFQIQMGSDISPNNIFGAPDIAYFKDHGIIRRHVEGFLPDALIAFCSEFYRVSDQVANSGLLTILNEGEYKNGTELIKTNLRFFMADTNFFPKQADDLDVEEEDLRLMALHDRFLARVLVKPLQERENQVHMVLMDDAFHWDDSLPLKEMMLLQDRLETVTIPRSIAENIVEIAEILRKKHQIFISPRRVKTSRNLLRASALLNGRSEVHTDDLTALRFAFWQKEEDIPKVRDVIYDVMDRPKREARRYEQALDSILREFRQLNERRLEDHSDPEPIYQQTLSDLQELLERLHREHPDYSKHQALQRIESLLTEHYDELTRESLEM